MDAKIHIDSEISELLDKIGNEMKKLKHPPLDKLTPKQSRYYYQVARTFFISVPVSGVVIENNKISSQGFDIPIRIYTPNGKEPLPVLVYFHGGGWVFGNLDSADNICSLIAKIAKCIVVSVGYRQAPEHKYPAALNDAVRAIEWTYKHMQEWNLASSRLAIGGESSGGNLAAAAALKIRDINNIPILLQFLITPVLHYSFETDSYNAGYNYNLTKEKMNWFWNHYLEYPHQGLESYASPLTAEDIKGLPPAFIVTAQLDPLRDEGYAYAKKLKDSGIPVEYKEFGGLVHSFINMIGEVQVAKKAFDQMVKQLSYMLHK